MQLSPQTFAEVKAVFEIFDLDKSGTIDRQEAIDHWKGAFGKISAKEFFKTVDVNNDGSVSYDECRTFWEVVKGSGHDEDEILEELERIKKGESWVGFENLPKTYKHSSKN